MINKGIMKIGAALFVGATLLGSCSEDIDESNLYTFTGETIEDYLANREDYSSFNYILDRAGYTSRLSAYGEYTCFAPNNEAVTEYIDSLYNDLSNPDLPRNGMTENSLEGLTDSLCKDIALYHLASTEWRSVNMEAGATINTLLGRDINTAVDSLSGLVVCNSYSVISSEGKDITLENGILHEINHVLRRSNALVAGEMEKHPTMETFLQALKLTGLADSLSATEKELTQPSNGGTMYTPETASMGYTIFVETEDALKANGINSLEDLIDSTKVWYGDCANSNGWYDYARNNGIEISTGSDYTNQWNTLNMFIRYHILKFRASYDKLLYDWNQTSAVTLYEYYETMLPYTLMKIERLSGQRYINPYYSNNTLTNQIAAMGTTDMHHPMTDTQSLDGEPIYPYTFVKIGTDNTQALNGYLHPINRILRYGYWVPRGVLNERMRFDDASLLWELMSSNLRGATDAEIKALNSGESGTDGNLNGDYVRCPEDFFSNLKLYNGDNTRLYYLPGRGNNWQNYQGDEFNCKGVYDFALRLPPVPDGTYEVRIGYSANGNRGMLQFYLGRSSALGSMKALDIPLDMTHVPSASPASDWRTLQDGVYTINYDAVTGWTLYTNEDDQGVESDGNMRNLGYMRGSLGFTIGKGGSTVSRASSAGLRRIIIRDQFEQGDYWLRFKSVLKDDSKQFHLDFIEFCPEHVYNNPDYAEDMY